MLAEIQCDKFISKGKPRKPITFEKGLNTILGGQSADNSIGKSTFLLIIDYVFGGNTYSKSDAVNKLGNHTINFAFKFNDETHYFCRDMINSNKVWICDKNYNQLEPVTIDNFRKFLFDSYNINLPSMSFRDVISRYFRIYGKENCSETKPLNSYAKETGENSIIALEKLFNVYSKIEKYKIEESEKNKKKNAFRDARKHEFVCGNVTTKPHFEENEKIIKKLESDLREIVNKQDKDLCNIDLSNAKECAEIRSKITSMKRNYTSLLSKQNILKININENLILSKEDLNDLGEFFPNVNFKKIEEIEKFHSTMKEILKEELLDESSRINFLAKSTSSQIRKLEEEVRQLGIPTKISKTFLNKYSKLENEINNLKKENQAYTDLNKYVADWKVAKENLKNIQNANLRNVESEINEQMVRYNDFIYNAKRRSPVINLTDGKKYTFKTPDDSGTGTSYKSLIVFDLSILNLTPLPAIAHDSLIFKNIGDEPIDKIMELYMKSEKQIFISFDKENSYSDKTRKILNDTAVLSLNEGGDELFGCSWNKKDTASK